MGSIVGIADERPAHNVTLRSFYLDSSEVTQEEWVLIFGNNPSYFSENPAAGERQEKRPVEKISWYDALVYCNLRSKIEGFTPCYSIDGTSDTEQWGKVPEISNIKWNNVTCDWDADGYRLPTESEWEYAALMGEQEKNNSWNSDTSDNMTHETCKLRADKNGISDLYGNVWEWCWDWYTSYPVTPQENPHGPAKPDLTEGRTGRGGAWNAAASDCSLHFRNCGSPASRYNFIGLRVARNG